jgi:hypothetical protein
VKLSSFSLNLWKARSNNTKQDKHNRKRTSTKENGQAQKRKDKHNRERTSTVQKDTTKHKDAKSTNT